jgi:gliding motility-associated-like protein
MKINIFFSKPTFWTILLFYSLLNINASAQCPGNIGFEQDTLLGWQGFISVPSPAGCCFTVPPNPLYTPTPTFSNQVINRITVTSGTGVDPYSGLPVVYPYPGNLHSVKIGNDNTGAQAEKIRTSFVVTPLNSSFVYRYAAVLNDANHTAATQSRVVSSIFDLGPATAPLAVPLLIPCASYEIPCPYINSPPYPAGWFVSATNPTSVICSNWLPVSVNLSNYIGHIIEIEFGTGDCDLSGHFGYTYIDIPNGCNPFALLNGYCPGEDTATLIGPGGFVSYDWYSHNPWTLVGSGQTLTVPLPAPPTIPIYSCIVTPSTGAGCVDTLSDTINVLPPPTACFSIDSNITFCANSPVQFYDCSYTGVFASNIISWSWDFNDPTTGANNFSTLQNPVHVFSGTGSYTIQLVVTSDLSCVSDTAWFTLVNITQLPVYPNAGNDTSICLLQSITMNPSSHPGYTVKWTSSNGLPMPLNWLTNDTIANTQAFPLDSITYYYTVTNPINGCSFTDSVDVNIAGASPIVSYTLADDTICPLGATQFIQNLPLCNIAVQNVGGLANNATIGTGSGNLSVYPTPLVGFWHDGRTQIIYTAAELIAAGLTPGQISRLDLFVTTQNSSIPYTNFTIKISCTGLSDFSSAIFEPAGSVVYVNPSYTPNVGLNAFTLNNRYDWDGVNNLLVEFCFDNAAYTSNDPVAQTATPSNMVLYDYADNNVGCNMAAPAFSINRPNLAFHIYNTTIPAIATYTWTPSAGLSNPNIAAPTAAPNFTTTYTVVVDVNGCSTTQMYTLVVDTSNLVKLGQDTTICSGQTYTFQTVATGTGPFVFSWTGTDGFLSSQPTPTVSPAVTTTYICAMTAASGCLVKDTIVVFVNTTPTSNFTVNPNPTCTGDNVTFTYTGNPLQNCATATFGWNWGAGAGVATGTGCGPYTQTWSTSGSPTISLIVTENGCSSSPTNYQLTVNLTPTSTFTIGAPVCSGIPTSVTYTGNATVGALATWNFGSNSVISAGNNLGPLQVIWNNPSVTNASLSVTQNGCTSTVTNLPVTVNQTPIPSFNLGGPTACTFAPVTITFTGSPATAAFNWSTGGASPAALPGTAGPHVISWSTPGVQIVTLSMNNQGCISSNSVSVNLINTPSASFSAPLNVCSGSQVPISYTGNGSSFSGYNWTINGNSNPVNLAGAGPHLVTWQHNGNTYFPAEVSLTVTENGCTSLPYIDTIFIIPIPTSDFSRESPVCEGQSCGLNFIGANATPFANYTYTTNNGTILGSGPSQSAKWSNAGVYNVTLIVSQGGCISQPTILPVIVEPAPLIYIDRDTSVCVNAVVNLLATGAESYVWAGGLGNTPMITVSSATTQSYTVTGIAANGCGNMSTATITIIPPPIAFAGFDALIDKGNSTIIGSGAGIPGYSYFWSPSSSINNDTLPNPVATPATTTTYIVEVIDQNGCINHDTVTVFIKACENVFVPKAFSPNNDLVNDYFFVANPLNLIALNRFEIYNRWGQLVYSTTDIQSRGWDGKYKGVDQESASYTFIVEATCDGGSRVRKEGNVALLR